MPPANAAFLVILLGVCACLNPLILRTRQRRDEDVRQLRRHAASVRTHVAALQRANADAARSHTAPYSAGVLTGGTAHVVRGWVDPSLWLRTADAPGALAVPFRTSHAATAARPYDARPTRRSLRWDEEDFSERLYLPFVTDTTPAPSTPFPKPAERPLPACTTTGVGHVRCAAPPPRGAGGPAGVVLEVRPPPPQDRRDGRYCGFPDGAVPFQSIDVVQQGIYEVTLLSGRQYLFKPECRPGGRYVGSHGWGGLVAHHLSMLLFPNATAAACAAGAVLTLPQDSPFAPSFGARCGGTALPGGGVRMRGVVAPKPAADVAVAPMRTGAGAKKSRQGTASPRRLAPLTLEGAQLVGDACDIALLDFLVGHTGRGESVGWSFDRIAGRLIARDYAAAFYEEACQPGLVELTRPSIAAAIAELPQHGTGAFCGVRRETYDRLSGLYAVFDHVALGLSEHLLADPLVQELVQDPEWLDYLPGRPGQRVVAQSLMTSFRMCGGDAQDAGAGPAPPHRHVEWVMVAVKRRLAMLVDHLAACAEVEGFAFLPDRDGSVMYSAAAARPPAPTSMFARSQRTPSPQAPHTYRPLGQLPLPPAQRGVRQRALDREMDATDPTA